VSDPAAERVSRRLVGFGPALGEHGLAVGVDELRAAGAALASLGVKTPDDLYWALRITLVRRHEQIEPFDAAYRSYWWELSTPLGAETPGADVGSDRRRDEDDPSEGERRGGLGPGASVGPDVGAAADPSAPEDEGATYSGADVSTEKTLAEYSPGDYAAFAARLRDFNRIGPWRPDRRRRPARHGRLDAHRTLRAALRQGGVPARALRHGRQRRRRRLVFVCDVSGSMAPYAQGLLTLAHVGLSGGRAIEVFAFATRLTRITRQLRRREPAAALTRASAAVVDWEGGTRIGTSLRRLDREYGGLLQGSTVIVASDGWDFGEPQELERALDHIRRRAHALVWLNPRLGDAEFRPQTRGMRAALPYLDRFLPCHDAAAMVALLAELDAL
jgi:hypothetical protein